MYSKVEVVIQNNTFTSLARNSDLPKSVARLASKFKKRNPFTHSFQYAGYTCETGGRNREFSSISGVYALSRLRWIKFSTKLTSCRNAQFAWYDFSDAGGFGIHKASVLYRGFQECLVAGRVTIIISQCLVQT